MRTPSSSSAAGGTPAVNRSIGRPQKKRGGGYEECGGRNRGSGAPVVWRRRGERAVQRHAGGWAARDGRRDHEGRREEGLGARQDVRGHDDRSLPALGAPGSSEG